MKLIVLFSILLAWGVLAQGYDSERDYSDTNQDSYDGQAPIENPIEQAPEPQQRPFSDESYNEPEPTESPRPDEEYRPQERESDSERNMEREDTRSRNTEEVPYDNYENEEDRSYEE